MVNTVRKGYRLEKMCADELRELGYKVDQAKREKYTKIDFFGEFDIQALAPDGSHIRFIQVKSNQARDARKRLAMLKMPDCCRKELWIYVDHKGWRKERIY